MKHSGDSGPDHPPVILERDPDAVGRRACRPEGRKSEDRLPVPVVGGEPGRVVVVPAIAEVGRRTVGAEPELDVVLGREEFDGLVLEDSIKRN